MSTEIHTIKKFSLFIFKALDLSHNNLSYLKPKDLKPVEQSLTHLYLSYNKLINITKDTFGDMLYLQWIDISHNRLKYIEQDTFANTKSIQVSICKWMPRV